MHVVLFLKYDVEIERFCVVVKICLLQLIIKLLKVHCSNGGHNVVNGTELSPH